MTMIRFRAATRLYSTKFNRPSPMPLPLKDQREFEELQIQSEQALAQGDVHPDARPKIEEFSGHKNPKTGELNGPKQDPLRLLAL
jgi:hypothetical protein